jgi:hypothetical protein
VFSGGKKYKTINSRYSLVVTHPTTNLPARGLSTAERTGSPVFHVLWSIAKDVGKKALIFFHNDVFGAGKPVQNHRESFLGTMW